MQERRWESKTPIGFDDVGTLYNRLASMGLKVRDRHQVMACYIEAFSVNELDEIRRLNPWPIEEITLVQTQEGWCGDFFLLAGRHHDLFRQHHRMESYLSLRHPWRIPNHLVHHHKEALFWIGFRDTHGFIRVRLLPKEIITPGETRGDHNSQSWLGERAQCFSEAVSVLALPLIVDWEDEHLSVSAKKKDSAVSLSWPDAFGACQFEYVVSDRYTLLVPAAQLISKLGVQPATVNTFISGFSQEKMSLFHQLQPQAQMLYRAYIHACLNDLPQIVDALSENKGRALINLCEFESEQILLEGTKAFTVIGVIGDASGYNIEVRFNRAPLPEERMDGWLHNLTGLPVVYSPLPVY